MRSQLVVVALALVTGLAGCAVTPEYHGTY